MSQPAPVLPPEEKFWKRHSPQHEFSLSSLVTVCLYLFAGILLWCGIRFVIKQGSASNPMPLDAIRVNAEDGPAGAGGPRAPGPLAPGIEQPSPGPKTAGPTAGPVTIKVPPAASPALPVPEEPNHRNLAEVEGAIAGIEGLNEESQKQLAAALKVSRGPGTAGSNGPAGPGTDNGRVGQGNLSVTDIRRTRWQINFQVMGPEDHLQQLADLGAILAVPEASGGYRVFRNLSQQPLVGAMEDISKINRIWFIDKFAEHPDTVGRLARLLGMAAPPPYVVAFFPEKLEEEMARMEEAYRGQKEKDIKKRFVFQVRRRDGKYGVVAAANQR